MSAFFMQEKLPESSFSKHQPQKTKTYRFLEQRIVLDIAC